MVGSAAKRRINRIITKYGESFLINDTTSAKGFFQMMTTGQINSLYPDTVSYYVNHPAYRLIASIDTQLTVGDSIKRDNTTMYIRKLLPVRLSTTQVYQIAYID